MEKCDELIFSNGWLAGVGPKVAHHISVRYELSITTPIYSINKRCGYGLKNVILVSRAIKAVLKLVNLKIDNMD